MVRVVRLLIPLLILWSHHLAASEGDWSERVSEVERIAVSSPEDTPEIAGELLLEMPSESLFDVPRARVHLALARAYRFLGEGGKVAQYQGEAEKLARDSGDPGLLADVLDQRVVFLALRGKIVEALTVLEEAFQWRSELGEDGDRVGPYWAQAVVSWKAGDLDQALKSVVLAMDGLNHRGDAEDHPQARHVFNTAGIIYFFMEEYERSLECYRRSLKLMETHGDLVGQAAVLANIGEVLTELGQLQEALAYHERSLKMERQLKNASGIAYSLALLADVEGRLGNPERMLELAEQATELHRSQGSPWGVGYSLIFKARALYELGRSAEAEQVLLEVLTESETISALENKSSAFRTLSGIKEDTGDYEDALRYLKALHEVEAQILDQRQRETIRHLEARYDAENREREIRQLKSEAELRSATLELREHQRKTLGFVVAAVTVLAFVIFL